MVFDLNHGGRSKLGDPKSDSPSDRINGFIESGVTAREDAKPFSRPYIGASFIGNHCLREVQLQYLAETQKSFKKRPSQFGPRLLRIFEGGHVIEEMVAGWMRLGGFQMSTEKEPGKQHGFHVPDINFKGHFDGIIETAPMPMELPCLWECKGLKASSWTAYKKNGVKAENEVYYAQIQVNQGYSGITNPCVFTIMNKDTSELHHELVPYSAKHATEYGRRAQMVDRATKRGVVLRRPYNDPNNWKCQACRWRKACWSMKA